MAELSSITITVAENGCIVNCEYRTPSKSKNAYDGYDYDRKTYTAPHSLIEEVMAEVGEEITVEAPAKKESVKRPVHFKNKS